MTIARVQGNSRGTSTGNSIAVSLSSAPTDGNMLIAVIGTFAASYATVSSISQTGVTWTQQKTSQAATSNPYYMNSEIWAGVVGSSAAQSLTVNLAANAAYGGIANVCEYSDLSTSSFLDQTASNNDTSGSNPTDTGTTSVTQQPSELAIGASFSCGGATTQSSPNYYFTLLDGATYGSYTSLGYLEKFLSTTGTQNSGATTSTASWWVGCIATFKASTGGGTNLEVTGNLTVDGNATINNTLQLPTNAPQLDSTDILYYLFGYDPTNGKWLPDSRSFELQGKLGTSYTHFKDISTPNNYTTNLFAINSSDNYNEPLLAVDRGFIVKKDLSAGGFVASNQGALALGYGLKSMVDPPKIWLFFSDTPVLPSNIDQGPSYPSNPFNGQLFKLTTDDTLREWHDNTGPTPNNTWWDLGSTSSYSGHFDTLHIVKADGSTPANLDLEDINIHGHLGVGDTVTSSLNPNPGLGLGNPLNRWQGIVVETGYLNVLEPIPTPYGYGDRIEVNTKLKVNGDLQLDGHVVSSLNPSGSLGLGSPTEPWTGIVATTGYFDSIDCGGLIHGGGGSGDAFKVGDDIYVVDINNSNRLSLQGAQDRSQAGIQFGSSGPYVYKDGSYMRVNCGWIVDGYIVASSWASTSQYGPLYRNSSGQIGYNTSSERFKDNINSIEDCSWLYNLRPVTFDWKDLERAKAEGIQIGLIAEEVNEQYPQLVFQDSEGKPEGVHYEWLGVPLLVEVKKLRNRIEALENQIKLNKTPT